MQRTLDASLVAIDDNWLEEFIRHVLVVTLLDGGDGVFALRALAPHEPIHRDLYALPALVAVHRVVAPDYSRERPVLLLCHEIEQVLAVARGRARRGVAAVADEVHVGVWDTLLLRGLE